MSFKLQRDRSVLYLMVEGADRFDDTALLTVGTADSAGGFEELGINLSTEHLVELGNAALAASVRITAQTAKETES